MQRYKCNGTNVDVTVFGYSSVQNAGAPSRDIQETGAESNMASNVDSP